MKRQIIFLHTIATLNKAGAANAFTMIYGPFIRLTSPTNIELLNDTMNCFKERTECYDFYSMPRSFR